MDDYKSFQEKLDKEHQWPTLYVFKFVVPAEKEQELMSLFPSEPFQQKKSKSGKYISFTLKKKINSSNEVVDIYIKAKQVDGMIAL